MQKNLVIVESPAKAKTIEKFLGEDFKVMSSYGHIRDLKKKNFGVDLETFKPEYEIPDDKKNVVKELRAQARKSEAVWLASDEDREGEAISWHLAEVLKINPQESKRIVFHEITKPAILDAIAHPRHIDLNLVDAQQARRVLDRYKTNKGQKIIFIHGKGEGVLRQAIIHELNYKYKHFQYQDASFQEYGYGATQVTIR